MNLKLFILLLVITNLGEIYGQETSIEEYYNLKGKVKKIRYDSYLSKMTSQGLVNIEKGWEDAEKSDKLIEFNEYGKIIKISFFNKDLKLQRIHQYNYNGNKLINSTTKYEKSKYSYDSKNRISNVTIFDRAPNVITANNINETNEKEKLKVNYKYDETEKLKQKITENLKNGNISITSYFYDEKGFLQKEETITNDYKEWYLYKYDKNGKIVNKKWLDNKEGIKENETNTYLESEIASSVWENFSEGELEGKITYKYENGNEIEINEFDIIDKSQKNWNYSYEYDSQKNWIKKIAHTYKDEYFVVNRKIEYY